MELDFEDQIFNITDEDIDIEQINNEQKDGIYDNNTFRIDN